MHRLALTTSVLISALILFGGCAADYKVAPSGFLAEETYASLDDGEYQDQLVTWSNESGGRVYPNIGCRSRSAKAAKIGSATEKSISATHMGRIS